jgi:hypothetical protein
MKDLEKVEKWYQAHSIWAKYGKAIIEVNHELGEIRKLDIPALNLKENNEQEEKIDLLITRIDQFIEDISDDVEVNLREDIITDLDLGTELSFKDEDIVTYMGALDDLRENAQGVWHILNGEEDTWKG